MELLPSKHISNFSAAASGKTTAERKDVYDEAFNRTGNVLSVRITWSSADSCHSHCHLLKSQHRLDTWGCPLMFIDQFNVNWAI